MNRTGTNLKPGGTVPHGAPTPAFPAHSQDLTMTFAVPDGQSAVAVSPDSDGEKDLPAEVKGK